MKWECHHCKPEIHSALWMCITRVWAEKKNKLIKHFNSAPVRIKQWSQKNPLKSLNGWTGSH